jgi:hypothetical protein
MTTRPSWLDRAVVRGSERTWTLGSVFSEYCRTEGLTREQLSSLLGCDIDSLAWLSLCHRPAPEQFAEDIAKIVERFQIDGSKLARLLRQVDALSALRRVVNTQEDTPMLLAARDRDKETDK